MYIVDDMQRNLFDIQCMDVINGRNRQKHKWLIIEMKNGDRVREWWAGKRARAKAKHRRLTTEEYRRDMERKTKKRPPNKFDGIQLNEYRVFATVPFIDKILTNIETIY